MLEATEQGGTTGTETPTGEQAQAAQAQANAAEQGGGTQSEAGTQQVERPGYLDSMPDTHKNNESLYQFKTQGELADAALKSLEKQELKAPGPDAEPEELASWRTLTGVPVDANGYEFSKPEGQPEGLGYSEEKAAAFAKDCHEKGISKEHARFMFDRYNGEMAAMFTAQDKALNDAISANKKKLEETHKSGFEDVMKQSDEIVFRLGGSEFLQGLESEGLKTDVLTSPTMINLFMKLKTAVIGDSSQPGPGGGKGADDVPRDERGHAEFVYPSTPGQESAT